MTNTGTDTMTSGGGGSELTERAAGAVDQATSAVGATAATARDELDAVASEASQHAEQLVREARREVADEADRQVRRAAGNLHTVADDVTALAEGRPREGAAATTLARRGGEQLDRIATRLEHGGSQVLLSDVRRFARRRPGVFLVGALGAGFVVGRMLRNGAMAGANGNGNGSTSGNGDRAAGATDARWGAAGLSATSPGDPILTPGGAAGGPEAAPGLAVWGDPIPGAVAPPPAGTSPSTAPASSRPDSPVPPASPPATPTPGTTPGGSRG
ncbi:MAG: hypothetical protein U0Q07_13160 [Acidimicrobiales bacterium]